MKFTEPSIDTLKQFKELIKSRDILNASLLLNKLHSADIAELLNHESPENQKAIIFLLPLEKASEVISLLENTVREDLLEILDTADIPRFLEEMDIDDATDIVSELEDNVSEEVLSSLEPETSKEIKKLLQYPEESAGGIMSTEYIAVNENTTQKEIIDGIRSKVSDGSISQIYSVFVTNDDGILSGYISLQNLILALPHELALSFMDRHVVSVNALMDQEEVVRIAQKYDLVTIPVVDENEQMIGKITFDDVHDVFEMEKHEDQGLMSGTGSEEVLERSVIKTTRDRIPWLFFGLLGGIISAYVIRFFQPALDKVITLAFFIPVVACTAGNISIQSSSITVRGLATGEILLFDSWKRILKELKVSLINGIIISLIMAIVTSLLFTDVQLALVLSFSFLFISIIAGLVGSATPLILYRLNIDPALATGPFITTANDILGLLIYFGIFWMYLF